MIISNLVDFARQIAGGTKQAIMKGPAALQVGEGTDDIVSHLPRGGTIDVVAPVAKKLKAAYLKHGIAYRLSRLIWLYVHPQLTPKRSRLKLVPMRHFPEFCLVRFGQMRISAPSVSKSPLGQ
jgi:hypothetical protein